MSFFFSLRRHRNLLFCSFLSFIFFLYFSLYFVSFHFFHPALSPLCVLSRYARSLSPALSPAIDNVCPNVIIRTRYAEITNANITDRTLYYDHQFDIDVDDVHQHDDDDDNDKENNNNDNNNNNLDANDRRFRRLVESAFIRNFEEGLEIGAQLTVYRKNKKIVDIFGSLDYRNTNNSNNSDENILQTTQTEMYSNHSLQRVFSCTKVLESLAVAILVDRGLLSPSLSEPVSSIWPEFSQTLPPRSGYPNDIVDEEERALALEAKSKITVKDVMQHSAGLCYLTNGPMTIEALRQYSRGFPQLLEEHMQNALPRWHPSSRKCYHGATRGFILGPIISRVDPSHRLIHTFIQEEILRPLRLEADFFLPMPDVNDSNGVHAHQRIQKVVPFPVWSTIWNVAIPLLAERFVNSFTDFVTRALALTDSVTTTMMHDIGRRVASNVWNSHRFLHDEIRDFLVQVTDRQSFLNKAGEAIASYNGPVDFNNGELLDLVFTSGSGIGNAAALARIGSLFANNGTVDIEGIGSVTLVRSSLLVSLMSCPFSSPEVVDAALGYRGRLTDIGLGCGLYGDTYVRQGGLAGWRGFGGSMLLFSERTGVAIGYAINRIGTNLREDRRSIRIFKAIQKALDLES